MKKDRKRKNEADTGISRRKFISTVGAGTLGAAVAGNVTAAPTTEPVTRGIHETASVTLFINGRRHRILVEPRLTLLDVLHDHLGMTGTKPGCARGECGACTVLIDGKPRYSCLTLALEAEGHEITTIEGVMRGEQLGSIQKAFVEEDALQCGYCTPGQVMAATGLLKANPNPSMEDIREGMSGNLCRCGTYNHIFKAVRRAADLK